MSEPENTGTRELTVPVELKLRAPDRYDNEYDCHHHGTFEEMVADRAGDILAKKLYHEMEERLRAQVDEIANTVIEVKLSKLVDDLIAEGIPTFSRYGREAERISIPELVEKHLSETVDDTGYRGTGYKGPRIGVLARQVVGDAMQEKGKTALAEAQMQIKKAVEGDIRARLNATLRKALGL